MLAALYRAVQAEAGERGDVCGFWLYVEAANAGAQAAYRRLGMEDSSYRMMEVALGYWSGTQRRAAPSVGPRPRPVPPCPHVPGAARGPLLSFPR